MNKFLCLSACMLIGLTSFAQSVNITFNLNMNGVAVDPGGVFIAGGSGFGSPGDNPMTDLDGDGIYTITISKAENFSSFYTFLNGNCGDYSCKEVVAGQACSDPMNFDDRFIAVGTNDTTVNTCFGLCTETTDCSTVKFVNVTFNLDMSGVAVDPGGVYVAGGGAFGAPGDFQLTDPDGDSIYSGTFSKPEGLAVHYTFANGACGDFSCKEDIAGQSCADPDFFNDRFLELGSNDTAICTTFGQCVFQSTCDAVSSVEQPLLDHSFFSIQPNRASRETSLIFSEAVPDVRRVEVMDLSGKLVKKNEVAGTELRTTLSLEGIPASLYLVKIQQGDRIGIQKLQVVE